MSNGLFGLWRLLAEGFGAVAAEAETQPATAPAAQGLDPLASPFFRSLLAVGLCTLTVYVIARAMKPAKMLLARTPGRKNDLNWIHVAGLFALTMTLLPYVASELLSRLWPPTSHQPLVLDYRVNILVGAINAMATATGSLLLAAYMFRHGLRPGLGLNLRHWFWDLLRAIVAYLALLPVCYGLLWISGLLLGPSPQHPLLKILPGAPLLWKGLIVFEAAVLAPIAEELFFRGLLQSMLRKYLGRPWPAILITAAIFAAVHLPLYNQMPPIMLLGIVLGYNYERTGRLVAPMIIHSVFNAVFLGLTLAGYA